MLDLPEIPDDQLFGRFRSGLVTRTPPPAHPPCCRRVRDYTSYKRSLLQISFAVRVSTGADPRSISIYFLT